MNKIKAYIKNHKEFTLITIILTTLILITSIYVLLNNLSKPEPKTIQATSNQTNNEITDNTNIDEIDSNVDNDAPSSTDNVDQKYAIAGSFKSSSYELALYTSPKSNHSGPQYVNMNDEKVKVIYEVGIVVNWRIEQYTSDGEFSKNLEGYKIYLTEYIESLPGNIFSGNVYLLSNKDDKYLYYITPYNFFEEDEINKLYANNIIVIIKDLYENPTFNPLYKYLSEQSLKTDKGHTYIGYTKIHKFYNTLKNIQKVDSIDNGRIEVFVGEGSPDTINKQTDLYVFVKSKDGFLYRLIINYFSYDNKSDIQLTSGSKAQLTGYINDFPHIVCGYDTGAFKIIKINAQDINEVGYFKGTNEKAYSLNKKTTLTNFLFEQMADSPASDELFKTEDDIINNKLFIFKKAQYGSSYYYIFTKDILVPEGYGCD